MLAAVLEPRRKAFGSLRAWELPDLKTFAVAVLICWHGAYRLIDSQRGPILEKMFEMIV
jgi:hypothetical protein